MARYLSARRLALAAMLAVATPALAERPATWSDQSYYLPMRDGTRIAVSLYFPNGKVPTAKATTIFLQTRYGRASSPRTIQPWRDAGYVVAVVDTRGSTSSFGPRVMDIDPDEVRDMEELVAHLATRPWSNGKVVATGSSYLADTADWATSRPAPGLVGSIPRQTDFDVWSHLFVPGGVWNDLFLNIWGERTREMDLGEDREKNLDCRLRAEDCSKLFPVLQPVDGDDDYKLLREALAGKRRWAPDSFNKTEFRDDKGTNGYSLLDSSPAHALADIRREKKPVQYWGSWVDAGTAEAALARYRSTPEVSSEVWITPNSHGNNVSSDPFLPPKSAPAPAVDAQFDLMRSFVEKVQGGATPERVINYYVLGSGSFRRTNVWPPADVQTQFLAFGAKNTMGAKGVATGVDRYAVDFTATTGKATRWSSQLGTPAAYPDRRDEDRKLLVYDGAPATQDTELVGTPVITLHMSSKTADPAVFVYLEDVGPDGRVTYLTEGQLRAVHRKIADPATLPYDQGPAPHSYKRADAMPVKPGEQMEVKFALQPVAALLRQGHHLRVAIAGGDADNLRRYSEGKPDVFEVRYGGNAASGLEITTRPWKQ